MKSKMNIRVYYQDTDAGGIVYHSKYLDFAERARSELLVAEGLSNKMLVDKGIAFVLRSAEINFHRPARLDDVLSVESEILEIKNASMRFLQSFFCGEELLVEVVVQLAFVNPVTLKPMRMPAELKELFIKYVKEN